MTTAADKTYLHKARTRKPSDGAPRNRYAERNNKRFSDVRPTIDNSFGMKEVEAVLRMHGKLFSNPQAAKAMATDAHVLLVMRKFSTMREKHRAWDAARVVEDVEDVEAAQ